MSAQSVTYTFSANTKIKSSEVNQDFSDAMWNYTTYVPTWSTPGTQPVLGNGTITGIYGVQGYMVHVAINLLLGSTTTTGSGIFLFSVPISPDSTYYTYYWGSALGNDPGVAVRHGLVGFNDSTHLGIFHHNDSAGGWQSTNPHTWGNGDGIRLSIIYRR